MAGALSRYEVGETRDAISATNEYEVHDLHDLLHNLQNVAPLQLIGVANAPLPME